MIVWVASYPRSGNRLCRDLLLQLFGLSSVPDVVDGEYMLGAVGEAGSRASKANARYLEARECSEISLVKTHRAPVDEHKAIYIVRDGRKAYVSYACHEQAFASNPLNLLQLILGSGFFGGWSQHYQRWMQAANPKLLLRYEDLVQPSQDTIAAIAEFLALPHPKRHFANPFAENQRTHPKLFREGQIAWQGADGWSDWLDAAFFFLHGALMVELGYANQAQVSAAIDRLDTDTLALLKLCAQLANAVQGEKRVAAERLAVIDELKRICDERFHSV